MIITVDIVKIKIRSVTTAAAQLHTYFYKDNLFTDSEVEDVREDDAVLSVPNVPSEDQHTVIVTSDNAANITKGNGRQ